MYIFICFFVTLFLVTGLPIDVAAQGQFNTISIIVLWAENYSNCYEHNVLLWTRVLVSCRTDVAYAAVTPEFPLLSFSLVWVLMEGQRRAWFGRSLVLWWHADITLLFQLLPGSKSGQPGSQREANRAAQRSPPEAPCIVSRPCLLHAH